MSPAIETEVEGAPLAKSSYVATRVSACEAASYPSPAPHAPRATTLSAEGQRKVEHSSYLVPFKVQEVNRAAETPYGMQLV